MTWCVEAGRILRSSPNTFLPSCNGNDQISYYDPAFCYSRPFTIESESNPTSKQETNNRDLPRSPPLSFFHFPSPPFEETETLFLQNHDFLLPFHHQAQPQATEPQPFFMEASVRNSDQVPRRRTAKRDRHSKINTAKGLRDRRMRLSLEVAKRFFGLQDMLGFEKGSKTVEWLLNQAKDEISRVAKEKKKNKRKNHDDHNGGVKIGASSCSEYEEGVSSVDEFVGSGDQEQQGETVNKIEKRRVKHCRKISAFTPLAKECRERARERARERTREKMRTRGILFSDESKKCGEETNQDLTQLGSWNPFETAEESGAKSHSLQPSLDLIITEAKEHSKDHLETKVEAMAHDDDEDSLVILNKWSPSLIFNNSGFSHEVSLN
ncbi:hypothetical protein Fmac_008568 [Flemingia macrophylla]|uniref:Uncharacterized protein n=1 Tax=Flemingia macrophylla TaxID=520843 RepID=A0ABD1MXU5_9FABA